MSILSSIDAFITGTYTVTRRAPETRVKGRAVAGATSTLLVEASEQPLSGRDLQVLPEGQRADETRKLYSRTTLRARTPASAGDLVEIDGESWEVFNTQVWKYRGITYCRAYVSRLAKP